MHIHTYIMGTCYLSCAHFVVVFFVIYNIIGKKLPCATYMQWINLTKSFITLVILGTQIQKQSIRVDIQKCLRYMA